jgi:hypothetical protein
MVLRVAILRFLLLSHPRAEAAAACEQPCERQRRLDALAVEVFFSFIRTVEHDDRFLLTLAEALWQEMPTLSQSLSLLRF